MKKLILTINVKINGAHELAGKKNKVVMIPFSGEATGEYFTGKTIGEGVDTQIITENSFSLSARYMLEGADRSGKACRIFIENNGTSMENCKPRIITDSQELSFLETAELSATVEGIEGGVRVSIFAEDL